METGETSRWTVTVFSMRNLDLTAAWFRLLYRYLSRSTALAILAFTTLVAIVTCIAFVTHWLSEHESGIPNERIFRIVFICGQCFHTLWFPNDSTLEFKILYVCISKLVQQMYKLFQKVET